MTPSRIGILYTTRGDWAALIWHGYLYDPTGEWIGYLSGRDVFSTEGEYMGFISGDQRILRKRVLENEFVRRGAPIPPLPEGRPPIPPTVPLPPAMRELTYDLVDMLDEFPERFKQVSNARQDMD
jgi:hypothetical protein